MQGLHLTADLRGCDPRRAVMTEVTALREVCLAAVGAAGLTAVGELFHRFVPTVAAARPAAAEGPDAPAAAPAPSGITGVVLLAESHLAVHTWPELDAATVDVYVCNLGADNSARATALMDALVASFAPARSERHAHRRG